MKNTFGTNVSLTLFGESHGEAIGAVIDGLSPGIVIDNEYIEKCLVKRQPKSEFDTSRCEKDNFKILSGIFNGKTTGTPICIVIPNENTKSSDYHYGAARPSHADYSAFCKYHGYEDYRGGGHFSGRITAALVAAGAILNTALKNTGVSVGTHILSIGEVSDRRFDSVLSDVALLKEKEFPILDDGVFGLMNSLVKKVKDGGDSIGGITETAVCGLPAGVGEPWFDSLEGMISHAVFSIGGIKGIEFGAGFDFAKMTGSSANDQMHYKENKVISKTNNNGGINGGISNGMPVIFSCAVKPTPSIYKEQKTIDFIEGKDINFAVEGRHDPAIIRRICPVIDSVTALVLCDALATRFGTDVFTEGLPQ